jgi:hypothetical protein
LGFNIVPYQVVKSDGSVLVNLADDIADHSTSLTLLGRNFAGYGTAIADNFVRLLENGSTNGTPPLKPLKGQLWYDGSVGLMKVWTGLVWFALTTGVSSVLGVGGAISLTQLTTGAGINGLAPINSPAFLGTPTTLTTPTPGDSSLKLATTAFVTTAIGKVVSGVSSVLGLKNDITQANLVAGGMATLASPIFVGIPKTPTATLGVSSLQIASTEFVINQIGHLSTGVSSVLGYGGAVTLAKLVQGDTTGGVAPAASPALTGVPTAPTAATSLTPTVSNQIATLAFVNATIAAAIARIIVVGPTAPSPTLGLLWYNTSNATPANRVLAIWNGIAWQGFGSGTGIVIPPTNTTTPNAFSFTPLTNVALGFQAISNAITVSGLGSGVSVAGFTNGGLNDGGFNINGGAFSQTGTVANGNIITVRIFASSSNSTTITNLLTLGNVSAVFSVTTQALVVVDTTPTPFSFTPRTTSTVGIQLACLDSVTGANGVGNFIVSGLGPAGAAISVSGNGAQYGKNTNQFTSVAGTVVNGDTVLVLGISGAAGTSVTITLTIGTFGAPFVITTLVPDITPTTFSFTPRTTGTVGIQLACLDSVTGANGVGNFIVSGLGPAGAAISVSGPGAVYGKNAIPFTAAAGNVVNGDTVLVLGTSGAAGTSVTITLTIGTFNAPFVITTSLPDILPNPFSFTPRVTGTPNLQLRCLDSVIGTLAEGNFIVSGLGPAGAAISVSGNGAQYGKNAIPFTTAAGTVVNGDTVVALGTSGAAGTSVTITLTIGSFSAPYVITTSAIDLTPDAFSFVPLTVPTPGVLWQPPAAFNVSNGNAVGNFIVSGLGVGVNAPISVSGNGAQYGKNTNQFTNIAGTVTNGDVVTILGVSGPAHTSEVISMTIGTFQAGWTLTTA